MKTPTYKDDYPECKRVFVQFQVTTPGLSAAEISAALRAAPTSTEKGTEGTVWLIESTEVRSKDIRRHIDWLIDRLRDALPGLTSLRDRPDTYVALLAWWTGQGFPHGPSLSPPQMQRLAELDLQIDIGITQTRRWWESWWFWVVVVGPFITLFARIGSR